MSASAPDNLGGAPIAPDGAGNGSPLAWAETEITAGVASSGDGVLVSLFRSVGAIVAGGVTGELAADGCWMSIQKLGNAAQGVTLAKETGNGVSFMHGELVVCHVVTPISAEEDAGSITGSLSLRDGGVALSLANRGA